MVNQRLCVLTGSLCLRAGLAVGLGIGAIAEVAKNTLRPPKQSESGSENDVGGLRRFSVIHVI